MDEQLIASIKGDCAYSGDFCVSAVLHPANYPHLKFKELQSADDGFRLACRYPKDLNGSAYLFHIDYEKDLET